MTSYLMSAFGLSLMAKKRLLQQVLFILILSSIIGLGANFHLIKKYLQREFRQSFLSSEKFPAITFISLPEAEELFVSKEAIFIDSRPKADYWEGHILGALSIPFEQQKDKEALVELGLLPDKSLVVYCDGGACQSSVELAKSLAAYGFKSIKVFFGGWVEWVQAGLPISKEDDWQ